MMGMTFEMDHSCNYIRATDQTVGGKRRAPAAMKTDKGCLNQTVVVKLVRNGQILDLTEPVELVDILGVEINKRGFEDNSGDFGLNNWKDGVAIN